MRGPVSLRERARLGLARAAQSSLALPVLVWSGALAARLLYLRLARATLLFDHPSLDSLAYIELGKALASSSDVGRRPFLRSPLYPQVLALFVDDTGAFSSSAARLFQACSGALVAALGCFLAQRLAGRAAGLTAGIAIALFGPLICADGAILPESLATLLFCGALLLLPDGREQPTACGEGRGLVRLCAAGLIFALAAALRPTLLVCVAWAILLIGLDSGRRASARVRRGVCLGLGTVMGLSVFASQNYARSDEWVLLSANGGLNFWIGNHQGASGLHEDPPGHDPARDPAAHELAEKLANRPLTYQEASAFWSARALSDMRADPLLAVGLFLRKMLWFGHPEEVSGIGDGYAFYRSRIPALRFPLDARYVLLAALLAPLALLWAKRRELAARVLVLSGFGLAYAAGVCLFLFDARYRLIVMPLAIVLAAVGAVTCAQLLCRAEHRARAVALILAYGLGVLGSVWLYEGEGAPLAAPRHPGLAERLVADALAAEGSLAEATVSYQASLAAADTAVTRTNYGNVLARLGQRAPAEREYRAALALEPCFALAHFNLGELLARSADGRALAERAYEQALTCNPALGEGWARLGSLRLQAGDTRGALPLLERALTLLPPSGPERRQAARAYQFAQGAIR